MMQRSAAFAHAGQHAEFSLYNNIEKMEKEKEKPYATNVARKLPAGLAAQRSVIRFHHNVLHVHDGNRRCAGAARD